MVRRSAWCAALLRLVALAILSTHYFAESAEENGLDCSDKDTPPWLVSCQADLEPSERWIYVNKGRFLDVNGKLMHYVDIGGESANASDRVYVFLQGQPTWSYIWRNIFKFIGGCRNADFPEFENACNGPDIEPISRAIVVDNVGFGRSAKPPIQFGESGTTPFNYSLSSHVDQLEGMLDALGLGIDNGGPGIVLVAHDWGGAIALGYLGRRPQNVVGHVCLECIALNIPLKEIQNRLSLGEGCCGFVDQLNTVQAYKWVFQTHLYQKFMFAMIQRNLTEAETKFYSFPFNRPSERWGSFNFPQQMVFGDAIYANGTVMTEIDPVPPRVEDLPLNMTLPIPSGVWFEMQRGRTVLFNNPIPKLFFVISQALILPPNSTALIRYVEFGQLFPESFTGPVDLGQGSHYAQEDQPEKIVDEIIKWDSKVFG